MIYIDKNGRAMETVKGGTTPRIYWSPAMVSYMQRYYATTENSELAGCLGVSIRTLRRKAKELGLTKDREWLMRQWAYNREAANAASRRRGWPVRFKKGGHANPGGEYKKGHRGTPEEEQRRAEGIRRWNRMHPKALSERAHRAWETRRKNKLNQNNQ